MEIKDIKISKPIIIILIVAVFITGSYAIWTSGIISSSNTNTINAASDVKVEYIEGTNVINTTNELNDNEGKQSEYLSFAVKASTTGNKNLTYYIYFTPENDNTIDPSSIKLYLTEVSNPNDPRTSETVINGPVTANNQTLTKMDFTTTPISISNTSDNRVLLNNTININNNTITKYYRLRMWIDSSIPKQENSTPTRSDTTTENGQSSHDVNISSTSTEYKIKVNVYGE